MDATRALLDSLMGPRPQLLRSPRAESARACGFGTATHRSAHPRDLLTLRCPRADPRQTRDASLDEAKKNKGKNFMQDRAPDAQRSADTDK